MRCARQSQRIGLPGDAEDHPARLRRQGPGDAAASPATSPPAFAALSPEAIDPGRFRRFRQEISVIAARGEDGAYAAFDTVENRHRDHILDLTLAPATHPRRRSIGRPRRSRGGSPMRWIWSDCSRWRCSSIATAACWSTRSRRGRTIPVTGRSTPAPPASSNCISAPSPACRCRRPMRHSDAVMKNLVGSGGGRAVAGDPRHAGADPAPLWQGRGPARAEDGPRHPAVSAGLAAGSVRYRRGAGAGRAARGGGGSVPGRLSARCRGSAHAAFEDSEVGPALGRGHFLDDQNAAGVEDSASIIRLSNRPNCLDRHAIARRAAMPSASVVDAARCGGKVQRALRERLGRSWRNRDRPAERPHEADFVDRADIGTTGHGTASGWRSWDRRNG